MKRLFCILSIIWFHTYILYAHTIHVSVCNLEFDKGDLTISVKIFLDDLQLAIYHNTAREIDISNLTPESNTLVQGYIKKRLQISLNKENKIELKQSGNEINEDAIWFYYKIEDVPGVKNIHIQNTLLLDIYGDQTNLLIINHMGKQTGYRFNIDTWEKNIELK